MTDYKEITELKKRIEQLENKIEQMENNQFLRVKGIIIEDEKGNEKIIMGSPVPNIEGRKREETTDSLIFLDEKGNDRLILGEIPGPKMEGEIKGRRSKASGLVFHDKEGNERGGTVIFEDGSIGTAFDYPSGKEAISLGLLNKDSIFFEMRREDGTEEDINIGIKDNKPFARFPKED